jgi:hypothetical protein
MISTEDINPVVLKTAISKLDERLKAFKEAGKAASNERLRYLFNLLEDEAFSEVVKSFDGLDQGRKDGARSMVHNGGGRYHGDNEFIRAAQMYYFIQAYVPTDRLEYAVRAGRSADYSVNDDECFQTFKQKLVEPLFAYIREKLTERLIQLENMGTKTPSNDAKVNHPTPVGSPYGFEQRDWDFVAAEKKKANVLKVVFGFQYKSDTYDSPMLLKNVKQRIGIAVAQFNEKNQKQLQYEFKQLAAGYGEHLFNDIAREIISSDVAIFDVSDSNPNVMIEIGVALTWGTIVLLLKDEKTMKLPTDISGHTWVAYADSGRNFKDDAHIQKMVKMIEKAMQVKARNET